MKALLIIDVQQGMFSAGQPYDGEAVVGRLAALLAHARASGAPVFFVQHRGDDDDDPLAPDGPGFPFRVELTPLPDESVTVKDRCSAFQETNLDQALRKAGVDHLIVAGMQSEYCIDTTVRSAFEHGYKVTLIEDGHTTFDTPTLTGAQIVAHHNDTLRGSFASLAAASDVEFGGT